VQETFSSAFTGIDAFEWRSNMETWLYRIASNAALMRLRTRKPIAFSMDDSDPEEALEIPRHYFDWCCLPEQDFDIREAHGQIEATVMGLPENLKAVFLLRKIEGLSTEETANALGISVENVKVCLHRARLELRHALAGYFAERVRSQELDQALYALDSGRR